MSTPNSRSETTITVKVDGVQQVRICSPEMFESLEIDRLDPVREFPSFPGQTNWTGRRHCRRIDRLVPHESRLESRTLAMIDSDSTVEHIVAQPLTITWPDGAAHTLDYLTDHDDGERTLVDVKYSDALADAAEVFDRTAMLCADVGLNYAVATEQPIAVQRNLDLGWAGAACVLNLTSRAAVQAVASTAAQSGITISSLEQLLAEQFDLNMSEIRQGVMGLIHLGVVRPILLDRPLEESTPLYADPDVVSRWHDLRHPAHRWSSTRIPLPAEPDAPPVDPLHHASIPELQERLAKQTAKILEASYDAGTDWWKPASQQIAALRTMAYGTELEPPSKKTLENKRRDLRKEGWFGLVDRRTTKPKLPPSVRWPEFTAALEAEYRAMRSTVSGKTICERAMHRLEEEDRKNNRSSPMPGLRLRYQILKTVQERYSTGGNNSAKSRRSARSSNAARSVWDVHRFGEVVQIDATPVNVQVTTDDGNSHYRPLVLSALDVGSKQVVGMRLIETTERTIDLLGLLTDMADGIGDEGSKHGRQPLPPDVDISEAQLQFDDDGFPYVRMSDGREFRAFPPVRPEHLIVDRGGGEASATLIRAAEQLRISITHAATGNGAKKPHVERLFGTITSMFEQHKQGYLGRRADERHPHASKLTEYRIDEVRRELLTAMLHFNRSEAVYVGQLGEDRLVTRRDLMGRQLVDLFGRTTFKVTPGAMIDLLPTDTRVVRRDGFTVFHRRYDSNDQRFRRLVGMPGKVTVAFHDDDISQVWVKDPVDRTWITVDWTHKHLLAGQPMSTRQARACKDLLDRMEDTDPIVRDQALREFQQLSSGPGTNRRASRASNHRTRPSMAPVAVPNPPKQTPEPADTTDRFREIAQEATSDIA